METEKRRSKACIECRQQKLRCDASRDYTQPCSRCQQKNIECCVSKTFQRRKKQTKAQLRHENEMLRKQLVCDSSMPSQASGLSHSPAVGEEYMKGPASVEGSLPHLMDHIPHQSSHASTRLESLPLPVVHSTTTAQILGGLELEPRKIDDCFRLFFEHYAISLDLLDHRLPPNQYHRDSSFLFWAIVITGARRYLDDPTIIGQLIGRVINLALLSLSSHDSPLQTVIGLLILCNWTLPIETVVKDLSHVFGGAAMQIAIQNGLHVFGNGQDFARTCLWPNASECAFRSQLWAFCLLTCQSTSFCDGLPPSMVIESFDVDSRRKDTPNPLPSRLAFLQRLHKVQTRGLSTIVQNGLNPETASESSALCSLIDVFDFQIQEFRGDCIGELDYLNLDCARLHIRAFHFFAKPEVIDTTGLIMLFSIARSVLDRVSSLDALRDFALYTVQYVFRTVLLAAFSILKISRSHLAPCIDSNGGEKSYFSSIQIAKRRSLQIGDVDSKCCLILTQLWSSKNVFKRRDGTSDGLQLRTRSRLSMGVVFDCFWWWRAEFGGQLNPYLEDGDLEHHNEQYMSNFDYQHSAGSINHGIVSDWQWAAGMTFPIDNNIGLERHPSANGGYLLPS
ncbi:hypothetical protein BJ878DRAFT_170303 [Calycina marina]|uniref:Zn(2)-C6 fungal-type domain-containing protein n=1 Tax=Calycina marina TaxID=1763456 RepID=A0A9P7YYS6_9HELO|nr:hypothetical protein BJ878DRAFT_170303 [Calycina marina]